MIFSMVIDPFYCGHEKSNDKLYRLPYVTPYISVDEFNENFNKFEVLLKKLALQQTELELQNIFSLKCGHCSAPLKYSVDAVSNEAYYYCNCASNKKKKVHYDITQIKKVVITVVHNYFQRVDIDYLQSLSIQALNQLENKLSHRRTVIMNELKEKEVSLALSDLRRLHPSRIQEESASIKQLKTDCICIDTDLNLYLTGHKIESFKHIIDGLSKI